MTTRIMKPLNPAGPDRPDAREARRAEALRLNLRRRKLSEAGSPAGGRAPSEPDEEPTGGHG
jgi:hypothetical protein